MRSIVFVELAAKRRGRACGLRGVGGVAGDFVTSGGELVDRYRRDAVLHVERTTFALRVSDDVALACEREGLVRHALRTAVDDGTEELGRITRRELARLRVVG